MISFSIICATKNEEQDVRIALESCVRQTYKADEIFFVDDSTDGTKDIIRQYHSRGVTLVDGEGHGCCQARNKAMELSSSDVIVFTNADIDLPVDYLERLSDIYENPLIDIVIPDSHVKNMDTIYARYVHYLDLADKVGRNSWTAQGYSVRRNSAKEAGWISGGIYPFNFCRDWTLGAKMQSNNCNKLTMYSLSVPHVCPDNFDEFWLVRSTRGLMSSYTKYFFENRGLLFVFLVASARLGFVFLGYLTLLIPFSRLRKHARYLDSNLKRENLMFVLVDALNTLAFVWGEFKGLFKILSWTLKSNTRS